MTDALDRIKNIDKIGDFDKAGYSRIKAMQTCIRRKRNLWCFTKARNEQYDGNHQSTG
jgi:hypothetical protein